jgi:hypothetical protein
MYRGVRQRKRHVSKTEITLLQSSNNDGRTENEGKLTMYIVLKYV